MTCQLFCPLFFGGLSFVDKTKIRVATVCHSCVTPHIVRPKPSQSASGSNRTSSALHGEDFQVSADCAMCTTEDVISWFRGIEADERIEVMCLLMDCCLPWEIRFLGTYIETVAQKDYQALRQAESTANNPTDLSYLQCLEDVFTRHKLCVSLALLHASNRQAAAVLFGILNDFNSSNILELELFTELSLLLTMSVNHPAFSFQQKYVLRSKLNQLKAASNTSTLVEVSFSSYNISFFNLILILSFVFQSFMSFLSCFSWPSHATLIDIFR